MLLILPLTAYLAFYLILRKKSVDWRRAALGASVFWGTSVVLITETLSLPRLITRGFVAMFWFAICVGGFLCLTMLKDGQGKSLEPRNVNPREGRSEPLHPSTRHLLAVVGALLFLVGVIAVISAPNMWDAMEYHLPRIVMWMSNHSVRFYPTPDYAQLVFGPWAEFAMMHVDLLWGGDRFVNLIEFFSMLGCVLGVSLIAETLGAGPRGQILAAVVCATIPEGILEASGPMNTYVVSFWITATVAFLLSWNADPSWFNTVCIGLSAGLAILTKGDAYVYLPFVVLACWWMGAPRARILLLKRCGVLLLLIFALNAPQYIRSYGLTGSPLGIPFSDGGPRLHWMVERITLRGALANTLRNISLHAATPSEGVNSQIDRAFRGVIRKIGTDPDDPQTIWPGRDFHANHFSLTEIHAGNPLDLLLIGLSMGFVFWKVRQREMVWYSAGIIAAFLLFCVLLRWQEWAARHHLPLFILASALVGFVLERFFSEKVGQGVAVALLVCALPFVLVNRTRSLIPWSRVDDVYHPRSVLYFADQHEAIAPSYIAAADAVNHLHCQNVAFDAFVDRPDNQLVTSPKSFFVYPLFAMIHADGRLRTVWYLNVHNLTRRYTPETPHSATACAVVCLDCVKNAEKWSAYRGGQASVFGDIVVFNMTGVPTQSHTEATIAN